jgi:purine-binding chemotaxis protein CheW
MTEQSQPNQLSSQHILEERARLLAQVSEEKTNEGEILHLTTFHIGGEYIGVPTSLVFETQSLRTQFWTRVPNAPAFIVGVLNLRGHIYSIMDLASYLGLPSHPIPEKAHVLLVKGGRCVDGKEMELTILADDVPEVCMLPAASLQAHDHVSTQEYILGVAPGMLVILDLERLLSDPRLIVNELD